MAPSWPSQRLSIAGLRLNVGCGATPTPGWINLDNSLSVRLGRHPWLLSFLARLSLVTPEQIGFAEAARRRGIQWADATRLPFSNSSIEAVYSSHMLEHLAPGAALRFLAEARRVLQPGGILRLALPDLRRLAESYMQDSDADAFVAGTRLAQVPPDGTVAKLRYLLAGARGHLWMYDSASLIRLLDRSGFVEAAAYQPGETTIPSPGALDLFERKEESFYVEARRPA